MKNNIQKIFDNSADVNEMDLRSDELKFSSQEFQFGTNRLEKIARARRLKMYLWMGALLLAFIFFVYLVI